MGAWLGATQPILRARLAPFHNVRYTDRVEDVDTQDTENTQDVQSVNLSVKLDPELHRLVRRAAYRREMTIAAFVRLTLREAAEFYARES